MELVHDLVPGSQTLLNEKDEVMILSDEEHGSVKEEQIGTVCEATSPALVSIHMIY